MPPAEPADNATFTAAGGTENAAGAANLAPQILGDPAAAGTALTEAATEGRTAAFARGCHRSCRASAKKGGGGGAHGGGACVCCHYIRHNRMWVLPLLSPPPAPPHPPVPGASGARCLDLQRRLPRQLCSSRKLLPLRLPPQPSRRAQRAATRRQRWRRPRRRPSAWHRRAGPPRQASTAAPGWGAGCGCWGQQLRAAGVLFDMAGAPSSRPASQQAAVHRCLLCPQDIIIAQPLPTGPALSTWCDGCAGGHDGGRHRNRERSGHQRTGGC